MKSHRIYKYKDNPAMLVCLVSGVGAGRYIGGGSPGGARLVPTHNLVRMRMVMPGMSSQEASYVVEERYLQELTVEL